LKNAFGPGTNWNDKPANTQKAIKEGGDGPAPIATKPDPGTAKPDMGTANAGGKAGSGGAVGYNSFPEPWRGRLVKDWENEIEAVKKAIENDEKHIEKAKKYKASAIYDAQINEAKAMLKKAEKSLANDKDHLAQLEANDPPFIHAIQGTMDKWNVGDYGRLPANDDTVFQVIDKTTMLVFHKGGRSTSNAPADMPNAALSGSGKAQQRVEDYKDRLNDAFEQAARGKDSWVMFKGFDTTGLIDGKKLALSLPLTVSGTTTYKAAGGPKTVLLVEPLSPKMDKK
jgi:hypothetical protein